ncbi:ankyrin repeat domain-containing protein [Paraburkholderia sp. 31.1]|uniref:ankyrin repeat domain-containing protein n=1 Tax=Paraburkholderia sp. 31.1 TaxID=2615205 RepID=UPI001655FC92|nr:ankyrin repeat domain-containing protein [Paraburkholderia sp. 31.1]MBC8726456.1 ankyrin repeat domain-containing protein [Paraburkholderia sp. 31.1]
MKALSRILIVPVLLLALSPVVHAMKKFPATDFFSGPQLELARAIERGDMEQVRLLAPKTDLKTPGRKNMTMLFFAFQEALQRDPHRLAVMSEVVKAGADPLQEVPNFGDPLGVMLNSSHPEFLRAMLDGGVDPNTMIEGRRPIIFFVTSDRKLGSLKLLVERGADVNRRDSLRNTSLYEALTGYDTGAVNYLLDHGANPNTYNINGISFPRQLESQIKHAGPTSELGVKLVEIRDRIIKMDVKWPPETPEQIKARWGASSPRRLDDSRIPLP